MQRGVRSNVVRLVGIIVAVVMSQCGAVRRCHARMGVVMSCKRSVVPPSDQQQTEDGEQREDQTKPQSAPRTSDIREMEACRGHPPSPKRGRSTLLASARVQASMNMADRLGHTKIERLVAGVRGKMQGGVELVRLSGCDLAE